ncbi:cyclopropane-fatty-acyl-phospholipid synthase family protein [Nocardiopsis sp. NRRL B-16309]|uniref:SAM-dependent methyltransferase n=1 Tax=Nocardiopsis sp. NRRL B-16309 TaxID=1519494 RepID=UPI0006AD9AF8|nr:methyltransferase domain-containing protein [Nocardiopsis sp. NRRL B-16309]KOX19676.1 methyltransferase [Nocardiopsis sp. NRRL B-16309]
MDSANDSATFWEKHYAGTDARWGTRPNVVLTDLLADLAPAPGTALDLGCGHGGDALWLAAQGWEVTAVDVSRTALDRVDAGAAATGVTDRVRTERHDLAATFPDGTYTLVAATYFHTPLTIPRDQVLRRAAAAVAPGGLLTVIEHASVAPWSWEAGKDVRFPTPDGVIASLELTGDWHVERGEAPQRTATGPGGRTATVTDNVIAVRRIR